MVHQHFRLVEPLDGGGQPRPLPAQRALRAPSARGRPAGRADRGGAPHAGRPECADLAALDRRAAAGGDHEGRQERLAGHHPRRADRRPDAAGGPGVVQDPPRDGGRGSLGDRHHPQAPRGDGGRRPRHRPSRRSFDRNRADRRGDRRGSRGDDGRPGRRARAAPGAELAGRGGASPRGGSHRGR